jgi:hypothetical protein
LKSSIGPSVQASLSDAQQPLWPFFRRLKPAATLTQSLRDCYTGSVTFVCRNTCQPATRIASVKSFVGDGIERDAPALGERRPQLFFRDTAIVGRADDRKRRCEQLLTPLVGPRRGNCRERR